MKSLRRVWSQSKTFRVILIVSLIYALLRLTAQVWLTAERMLPGQSETQISPVDLQIYVDAATRLENHQPLYSPNPTYNEVYQYPPLFALVFVPFVWLLRASPNVFMIVQFLLRLAGYCCLVFWWERIFRRMKLHRTVEIWAWTIPIWIVFSIFWSDLAYMNIYLITALLATFLIEAVLNENLGWSVVWIAILIQIKPHWAFAAAIPLLLGRWRFFLKLLVLSVVVNMAIVGLFLMITGPAYGWQQYIDYFPYVSSLSKSIPWRGPEAGFLGYNHSITQIVVFLLRESRMTILLAKVIKILLLVPLAVVCIRQLRRPARRAGHEVPQLALGLAFALYLGVFIWMDWVWEVSLGCAIFAYLLAMQNEERISKVLPWLVFIPYVLIDFWQIGSYAIFGDKIITPNDYLLTDYSIYLPIVMIVILVFYGLLIKRLWSSAIST